MARMRIAMLEGYGALRRRRRGKRRAAKRVHHKRKITAWNRKFGAAAKICLTKGGSRAERSRCMKLQLKKRS